MYIDLAKAESGASTYIILITYNQKIKTNKLQPMQRNSRNKFILNWLQEKGKIINKIRSQQ